MDCLSDRGYQTQAPKDTSRQVWFTTNDGIHLIKANPSTPSLYLLTAKAIIPADAGCSLHEIEYYHRILVVVHEFFKHIARAAISPLCL